MGKAQKPAWKGCTGSLMAKMKQNQHCERLDCQTLYTACPVTC